MPKIIYQIISQNNSFLKLSNTCIIIKLIIKSKSTKCLRKIVIAMALPTQGMSPVTALIPATFVSIKKFSRMQFLGASYEITTKK